MSKDLTLDTGELTNRQAAFVHEMARHGCCQTEAARRAGYEHPGTRGFELMRNPRVLEASRAEAVRSLSRGGVLAAGALERRIEEHLRAVTGEGDPGGRIADRELSRFLSLALDRAGYAGVKAVEAEAPGARKRMTEMSIDELEQFIAERKHAASEAAKVVEGTAFSGADLVA